MRRTVIRAAILVLVFVAVAPATALKYLTAGQARHHQRLAGLDASSGVAVAD